MSQLTEPAGGAGEDRIEEVARADVYGVLAALFYAPPQVPMLAALRAAPPAQEESDGGALEAAWQALAEAARAMEPADIASEYEALFGGVGKPDVYLFGSHYLSGFLNDKPLAHLRADLQALGVSKLESVYETEDHFSCLCDVMRHLIVQAAPNAGLSSQHTLFERHIGSWADAMCDAVQAHPKARFYACTAGFVRAFIAVEQQAFEMLEAEGGDAS
ncbi:MAG: molecular chaperone TorD family protein [Burkholderiales bacterium]